MGTVMAGTLCHETGPQLPPPLVFDGTLLCLMLAGLHPAKPALARGASRVGVRGAAGAPLGAPPDIIKELEHQRARQAEQLQIEAQARQQLEDMLLRIERHYKVSTSKMSSSCRLRMEPWCSWIRVDMGEGEGGEETGSLGEGRKDIVMFMLGMGQQGHLDTQLSP